MPTLSIRTWIELLGGLVLTGLLVWQVLTAERLRTQLANQKVLTRTEQLSTQAAETSAASCQAALGSVQLATEALVRQTQSTYGLVAEALQRGSGREIVVRQEVDRLLRIRPEAGQDCQTAEILGRSAWEEGQ